MRFDHTIARTSRSGRGNRNVFRIGWNLGEAGAVRRSKCQRGDEVADGCTRPLPTSIFSHTPSYSQGSVRYAASSGAFMNLIATCRLLRQDVKELIVPGEAKIDFEFPAPAGVEVDGFALEMFPVCWIAVDFDLLRGSLRRSCFDRSISVCASGCGLVRDCYRNRRPRHRSASCVHRTTASRRPVRTRARSPNRD